MCVYKGSVPCFFARIRDNSKWGCFPVDFVLNWVGVYITGLEGSFFLCIMAMVWGFGLN